MFLKAPHRLELDLMKGVRYVQARCCNPCILGAWAWERNPKPGVWQLSSHCGDETLLDKNRSAKRPDPLRSFRLSCRNVECNLKTRGQKEGKKQFSKKCLPLNSFKGCKKLKLGIFFFQWVGAYMAMRTVLDSRQAVGATTHEVGEGSCPSLTREDTMCPSFPSPMWGDNLQGMLEDYLELTLDLMSTRDHATGVGAEWGLKI